MRYCVNALVLTSKNTKIHERAGTSQQGTSQQASSQATSQAAVPLSPGVPHRLLAQTGPISYILWDCEIVGIRAQRCLTSLCALCVLCGKSLPTPLPTLKNALRPLRLCVFAFKNSPAQSCLSCKSCPKPLRPLRSLRPINILR